MRKFFLLSITFLLLPAVVYAATVDKLGSLSLSAGVGGSVNTSSGKSHFNYDNLFAGGADAINRGTPVPFHAKGRAEVVSKLNADYFQPLSEKILLGLGFSYFFESRRDIHSGQYVFANPNNRPDFPINYAVKTKIDPKGHFSVSLKPGYQIHKNVLIYSLFAYHHMRADVSSISSVDASRLTNGILRMMDFSDRRSFNGLGLGGGVKYKFFKNWFIDVSAEWVKFGRKKITGPSFTSNFDEATVTQDLKVRPSWVDITTSVGYQFG